MTAAAVTRSLADRRRGVLGYGVGLGLMIVWVMAIYPSVEAELTDYMEAMPEAMTSLFGAEDVASLPGFLNAEIFSLMGPLVFLALAITTGAATIAGEERDGVLPLVLATGVGRRSLLWSKFAALVIELAALGALTLGALLVGVAVAGGGVGIGALAGATVQLTALGACFGTLALAAGAATGSRGTAATVAVAAALVTYLVDALAGVVGWLEPVQIVSPFHWYAPGNPVVDGVSVAGLALLAGCTAALATVAARTFDRRDVGT